MRKGVIVDKGAGSGSMQLHHGFGGKVMPTEENKALARRYIEEIWNRGNLDEAQEIVTPTFTFQGPIRKVEGLDAFRQFVAAIRTTFPDLHFAIEDLIAENEKVVICWTMVGIPIITNSWGLLLQAGSSRYQAPPSFASLEGKLRKLVLIGTAWAW